MAQTVLLVDVGSRPMDLLNALARRLDYRVLRAKTADEAMGVLAEPRFAIGCAVVPPDLPVPHVGRALDAFREAARRRDLPFLLASCDRSEPACRAFAAAGVFLPLWDPVDPNTLRFQLNRALAGAQTFRRRRTGRRVPSTTRALVHARGRTKEARLYTLSTQGAFVATAMPSLRGTEVQLELPFFSSLSRLGGRVVMTNVTGNLMKKSLPAGMAIRFERLRVDEQAALELHVERKARRLELL